MIDGTMIGEFTIVNLTIRDENRPNFYASHLRLNGTLEVWTENPKYNPENKCKVKYGQQWFDLLYIRTGFTNTTLVIAINFGDQVWELFTDTPYNPSPYKHFDVSKEEIVEMAKDINTSCSSVWPSRY